MFDSRFRVERIAATPNPQQCIYAGMHQDYSEGFVAADRADWPDEARAGEICVKRLLAGERGHYGPLEHAQIVLNVGWFPHSVMQQARTHRVGVSFDVQSMRYTGQRMVKVVNGEMPVEAAIYFREPGYYRDRDGKKYRYAVDIPKGYDAKKPTPVLRRQVDAGVKNLAHQSFVGGRIVGHLNHPSSEFGPSCQSRPSQARANLRSRSTVLTEMPSIFAISSLVYPAKCLC